MSIELVSCAEIEEQEQKWLIPGWIPGAAISLIEDETGDVVTHIISALSSGDSCILDPEGHTRAPKKILLLSVEDNLKTALRPRLRRSGANLENIISVKDVSELNALRFGSGKLEQLIIEIKPDVCVFDPYISFIKSNRHNALYEKISQVRAIAHESGISVLMIERHKQECEEMRYIARSVIGVESIRGITDVFHIKSNYGEEQPFIKFSCENGEFTVIKRGDNK